MLQALLVACVVLWVMDVPRQVFGVSFYTEQLLTVCLGLTLALAFVTETKREYRAVDPAGVITVFTILAYIAYRFPNPLDIPPLLWAGLALALVWTFFASRIRFARWFDWACAIVSLLLCGYIAVALRGADLRARRCCRSRASSAARSCCSWCWKEAAAPRASASSASSWRWRSTSISARILPGDFQTRWVSPERLVAYLGLDVNSMIGAILQVAVLVVIPFTILGQVLARTGGADFFSDIAMAAMGRFRGGSAKIAVVGSALFGMISGSAVSNVLAVGIVTIPTMIRAGFSRYKSAAIEFGRLDRRPVDAAGDGRRRLHHGGVPAGVLRRGLHRRRDPGDPLLRLPVHPRRPRCRQA